MVDFNLSQMLPELRSGECCQNDVSRLDHLHSFFVVFNELEKLAQFQDCLDSIFHRHLEVQYQRANRSEYLLFGDNIVIQSFLDELLRDVNRFLAI